MAVVEVSADAVQQSALYHMQINACHVAGSTKERD